MNNQLEFSLFDYFADTKEGVAEMISVLTADTSAPATGKKSYVYDCGEELKGARKHLASLTRFSPEWYQAIEQDPSQAFESICKDELLGDDFKPESLKEQGFASEVAYGIKMILDRVCQRPDDNPKERECFVRALHELQSLFAESHNEEMFRSAFAQLKEGVYKAYWSKYPSKVEKEPEVVNYRHWLSLGERFNSTFFRSRYSSESWYSRILSRAFDSEEGKDWKWTESKSRSGGNKEKSDRWERRVPDEVIRLSKEPSGVEKPDDLIEHYGYRGIQFGNWVEDAAGRYHVLCSGNAHADLSAILQLPRAAISLYGSLGLAFGARGTGKASAHYEPHSNVINLTKMRGGGALAHEWAHALDYNLYSYSFGFTNGKMSPLSGNKSGERLPSAVQSAFVRLMSRIKKGNGLLRFEVPEDLPIPKNSYVAGVRKSLEQNGHDVTKALLALKGVYRISKSKAWEDIGITYCHMLKDAGREIPKEFFIPTDYSSFYLDAKNRGAYWRKDHELFARAFEAWIEDELAERGMTDSYLVFGTQFAGPYPYGDERIAINEAFKSWWKVLLDSGILQDERNWTRK